MKRTLLILAAITLLAACTQPYETEEIPDLGLTDAQSAVVWVADHISYIPDDMVHDSPEEWQQPHQTYLWGTGDCEDFALLATYLINRLGIEVTLETGYGQGSGHAWVKAEGRHWETTSGFEWEELPTMFPILRRSRTYEQAMRAAAVRAVVE